MTVAPGIEDFTIYQGADFDQYLLWKDSDGNVVDVSGYTARMQIRRHITSADPELELTTSDGRITLAHVVGPPEYNILLHISATDTAALEATASSHRWFYDLELVNGSNVRRLLQGRVNVSLEVTR